ncbi:MAG: DNA-protecting protein DprA [Calditrichaeota bacterium]|nr:MAG: DNA-protecting protein DprA [Calditrichota bacterium]
MTGAAMEAGSPKPEVRDILRLMAVPNIGPGRIRRLLSAFGSVEAILKAPYQKLVQIDGIDRKLAAQLKQPVDESLIERQWHQIQRADLSLVSIWDSTYPALLRRINDPPVLLFYRGHLPESWPVCLAVVGTRRPSAYGKAVTAKLVAELVHRGVSIVSGLARGIDTIAHYTALQRGGFTAAVLGCGADVVYPPENRKLYQEIAQNGLLVSEFLPGTTPEAVNFPRRNRIITGLSVGLLVVEAGQKSGALISARYALDQNREVFAVPGQITNPASAGTNRLIQQGAKLVQSVEDILEELPELQGRATPAQPRDLPHLNELQKRIMACLSTDPKHIDRLVMELRESPALVLSSLVELELMGLVRQLPGKMFIRM